MGSVLLLSEGWIVFFLDVLIDRTARVVGRVISIAEDTPDIIRSLERSL
jgi:hypothetical protein